MVGFPGSSVVKNLLANARDTGSILGKEDPLEEEMANHPNILAWRIPWRGAWQATSPRGHKESDTTKQLNTKSTSLSMAFWVIFPLQPF